MSGAESRDRWADWVLGRGHSGDEEQLRRKLDYLVPIRDRVLDQARLAPGDVLLDVGCGDGLIGFGALARLGPEGRVLFSDLSQDLIDHSREVAASLGETGRADFVCARAEDLSPIADASVDVVTTRSVLIYVDDKARAFEEFVRVLRDGGRVSLFEPINSYFPVEADDFWGFDAAPIRDIVDKVWAYAGRYEEDERDPMMNFTERDLLNTALSAGFREVTVDLVVEVRPGSWVIDWSRLLDLAPNPNAPTTRELLDAALTPEERSRFTAHMQPLVDTGKGVIRSAFAYVRANK